MLPVDVRLIGLWDPPTQSPPLPPPCKTHQQSDNQHIFQDEKNEEASWNQRTCCTRFNKEPSHAFSYPAFLGAFSVWLPWICPQWGDGAQVCEGSMLGASQCWHMIQYFLQITSPVKPLHVHCLYIVNYFLTTFLCLSEALLCIEVLGQKYICTVNFNVKAIESCDAQQYRTSFSVLKMFQDRDTNIMPYIWL